MRFDGFVLRPPSEGDADALVQFGDDPDTAETLWVPIPSPCSRAQAEERLREFSSGSTFVIADAVTDEFVGIVFLRERDDAVEVAYGIAPEHRGRGIATRALRRVSEELGPARVELFISQGNDASCRVAEKAGFEFRGITRNGQYEDFLYIRQPDIIST